MIVGAIPTLNIMKPLNKKQYTFAYVKNATIEFSPNMAERALGLLCNIKL